MHATLQGRSARHKHHQQQNMRVIWPHFTPDIINVAASPSAIAKDFSATLHLSV
jgi:hypothetical protein